MITDSSADMVGNTELISPDVGIVHRLDEGVTSYDHPRLAPAFAQACHTAPIFGVGHVARAGGMAVDPERARQAALGEAVERYSACHVPTSRFRVATTVELAGFPIAEPDWTTAPDPLKPISWVPGTRLRAAGAGEEAWVAASRVYLREFDDQLEVAMPTSTGLACHPHAWQALYSALLEVIERDAVMITWLTRSGATPIRSSLRWTSARGATVRFDRSMESYQLYLLDSPTCVPVVFVLAIGAERQPALAVGAAAHLELRTACRKALVEAKQTMHWATLMQAGGRRPADEPDQLSDFDDHVAYYFDPERRAAVDFLLDTNVAPIDVDLDAAPCVNTAEISARTVIDRSHAAAIDCFAVDVTAPDVRSAGLWVIRAVAPGLYPLLVGAGRHPHHPRLPANAPVNPDPHPFP